MNADNLISKLRKVPSGETKNLLVIRFKNLKYDQECTAVKECPYIPWYLEIILEEVRKIMSDGEYLGN